MSVNSLSCIAGKKFNAKFSSFLISDDFGESSSSEKGETVLKIYKTDDIYFIESDFNIVGTRKEFNILDNKISYNRNERNLYVTGILEENKKIEIYGIIFNLRKETTETTK